MEFDSFQPLSNGDIRYRKNLDDGKYEWDIIKFAEWNKVWTDDRKSNFLTKTETVTFIVTADEYYIDDKEILSAGK